MSQNRPKIISTVFWGVLWCPPVIAFAWAYENSALSDLGGFALLVALNCILFVPLAAVVTLPLAFLMNKVLSEQLHSRLAAIFIPPVAASVGLGFAQIILANLAEEASGTFGQAGDAPRSLYACVFVVIALIGIWRSRSKQENPN